MAETTLDVGLREVTDADVPVFFEHQQDEGAHWMAAFAPARDRDAFMAHWQRIRGDETCRTRAIVVDGKVAGNVGQWLDADSGKPEIGYWIAREYWGRGVATRAVAQFVQEIDERPLYAHVAADNIGSRRVLEKCGFAVVAELESFAAARGKHIAELVLELNRPGAAGD
jgi:RimJ/RimL family protein N-acetyltransferase